MSKPKTVKELYDLCKNEMMHGNGDKVIMISDDEEGNGFHYLWYDFCSVSDAMAEDFVNENIAEQDNTIILG